MKNMVQDYTKKAGEDLSDIKVVFDKCGIEFVMLGGVCLGAIRDENFIVYDNDIDIGIFGDTSDVAKKKVRKELEIAGFIYKKNNNDMEYYMKQVVLEIHWFKKYGWAYRAINCTGTKIYMDGKYFKNPLKMKFNGDTYLFPNPPREFLLECYGVDWVRSIKGKAPQWDATGPAKKFRELERSINEKS